MPHLTAQSMLAVDGWSMHGNVGFGWWLVMTVAMILFWGGVIALIVWLLRGDSRTRRRGDDSPREILDRRLAAGDLSLEEYEQRRRVLDRPADTKLGAAT